MNNFKVGDTVKVWTNAKTLDECYPWYGGEVPARIDEEYPNFYVVTVLPHWNASGQCFGLSKLYQVTIDKRDLKMCRMGMAAA